jgi:hypothetical protein
MVNEQARDPRIDVFRGLALWMIFVDHIPQDVLGRLTYRQLGFSDAKDIFVFLSGVSCCLLYSRLIEHGGLAGAQARAVRRVWQIYLGQACLVLATVAVFFAFRGALDPNLVGNDFALLDQHPLRAIIASIGLGYTPEFLDILPLYLILVAAAPLMIVALRRAEGLALGLSALLWLIAAAAPQLSPPSLGPTGVASLNPLSWQFLFCLGLWVGKRYFVEDREFRAVPLLQAICWTIVVVDFIAHHSERFGLGSLASFERIHDDLRESREQLLPLTHFLAVVYLTASYLRSESPLLRLAWMAPLGLCGRHSLEVFCSGVVLSMLGAIVFRVCGAGTEYQLAVNLTGFAAMVGVALVFDRKRVLRRRNLQAQSASAI